MAVVGLGTRGRRGERDRGRERDRNREGRGERDGKREGREGRGTGTEREKYGE